MIHHRTHPTPVEGCWACKVSSIQVGASATPTRRPRAVEVADTEKRWHKDIAAYKSMRAQGLQPPRIDGSHHRMTTSTESYQIEGKPKLWDRRDEFLTGKPPKSVLGGDAA